MQALSERAVAVLDRMEPNRGYQPPELRALAPGLNLDALREVMRELWVAREVERFGDSGWRRVRSASRLYGSCEPVGAAGRTSATSTRDAAALRIGTVRPEDLFDHESFAGWFK